MFNIHVNISLLETIHLKQLDEGCSLKYAGMCLKLHFWYEEKHQIIKSSCFRSAHRGGSLGSEILFPSRTGAGPFLQLSSRAEVSANCEVLLVYEGSANVVSPNKQDCPGRQQSCQHNCMTFKGLAGTVLWSTPSSWQGQRSRHSQGGAKLQLQSTVFVLHTKQYCGWMHLYPPTYFA